MSRYHTRGLAWTGALVALLASTARALPTAAAPEATIMSATNGHLGADEAEQARQCYLQARTTADDTRRQALFDEGLAHAERARLAAPQLPAALLWWVATMGEVALARGKLRALGDVPKLEQALKDLLVVDPTYESAAADRGLARLYQLAPPFLSIGSKTKAARHYAAAYERAPSFMGNLALYADFLEDRGDHARAVGMAQAALRADRSGIDPVSLAEWDAMAKAILGANAG